MLDRSTSRVALTAALALAAGGLWAETTNCTPITSLPATITSTGVYCLTQDLVTNISSGSAITIDANSVILDLNGHKLGGQAGGLATFARGVYAVNHRNITVKNGTIRGFYFSVYLLDSSADLSASVGNVIEDIRAESNTFAGIVSYGRGGVVRKCQVANTGGTSLSASAPAHGIIAAGPGYRVLNNDVTDTVAAPGAESHGITMYAASGAVVEGNRVSNTTTLPSSTGIYVNFDATDAMIVDNRISHTSLGVDMHAASDKYRDNLTTAVSTPYSGGTNAGNNN
jgi:Periplasmic copper-binding protein (NosD)